MNQGRTNELPDVQVFRTVFFYCFLVIALPVLTFFLAKWALFDGILRLEPIQSNVYSAVCTVIVLHVVLGLYIFKAYGDSDKPKPEKPVKKD